MCLFFYFYSDMFSYLDDLRYYINIQFLLLDKESVEYVNRSKRVGLLFLLY